MDEKKRPLSRKKHVVEGTAHVGERPDGQVPGQQAGPRPSGQPSGQPTGTPVRPVGVPQSGSGQTRSGGSSLMRLIVIVAAVLLLGGGGGGLLGGLFGGDSGGLGDLLGGGEPVVSTTAPAVSSAVVTPKPTATPKPASSQPAANAAVAGAAREKRTVLKGNGADTTTIMVYMCGTDLESKGGYATSDIQEMASAKLGDKVTLLVFTGGCKGWKNSVVSSSKNQIFRVRDGGVELLWESDRLQPMTDPATLAEYIKWGKANAPADRYELIFWDHGGGSVSGYGYDEAYPNAGSMTLDNIALALKSGGCTFDFVGFDACLMATLETALVVEPYADYLIASEETEPGCGWYYTDWLNKLSGDPSRTALQMGKDIADSFVNVCGQAAPRQQATLSVMDLAELAGTVPTSFQAFALSTAQSIKDNNYQSVAAARANTKEFAKSTNIDQVDLIHLASNMGTAESKQLAAALKSAVKYNATSRNIQNANGVSIYFPYGRMSNVNKMAQTYEKIGLDSAYTECIKTFASVETAGQSVYGGSSAQVGSLFSSLLGVDMGGETMIGGDIVSQLLEGLLTGSGRSLSEVGLTEEEAGFLDRDLVERSAGMLAEAQFAKSLLVWNEKDGQQVLWLPEEQWALIQDIELNVFVDDGSGFVDLGLDNTFTFNDDGDLVGEFDGTWLSLNGQIVAYYMMSSEGTEDDYKIMGRIPAMLNGQRVDLIACFTDEVPDGEILGAAICYDEETETETVAKGLLEIRPGDTIDLLFERYDYDRNYQGLRYLGSPITVGDSLQLANIRMDNSEYIAAYRLTDIYCNHFWTPSLR